MDKPIITGRWCHAREPPRQKKIRILKEKYRFYKMRASEYAELADNVQKELFEDYGINYGT